MKCEWVKLRDEPPLFQCQRCRRAVDIRSSEPVAQALDRQPDCGTAEMRKKPSPTGPRSVADDRYYTHCIDCPELAWCDIAKCRGKRETNPCPEGHW